MQINKNIKRFVIIWTIICMLLPTLFSGFVCGAQPGKLSVERAGNYAANFAINFYDNWSSISYTDDGDSRSITVNGDLGWPLSNPDYTITGNLGDLGNGKWKSPGHNGLDLAPTNPSADYEVYSVTEAVLKRCANDNGYHDGMGNYVEMEAGDLTIRYMHLDKVSSEIVNRVGDTIQAGTFLGMMGTTGDSTGKHLHIDFQVTDELTAKKYTSELKDGTPYITGGKGYFINPLAFISPDNISESSKTSKKKTTRGKIRTKYQEDINPYDPISPNSRKYTMNNKSWIGFVYRESLLKGDIYKVFSGVGDSLGINTSNFDDRNSISNVKDLTNSNANDIIDISRLISEGKILPGDILVAEYPKNIANADGTTQTQNVKEYLLYVGGTKIMYATEDELASPSGAIKYEYIDYYLKRIRRNLSEGHENDSNYVMPKFGITQIYRIKNEVAEQINEQDANLFFNGKGYYSKADYEGIPSDIQLFETQFNVFHWIFDKISGLLEFLLNLMVYMIRMQVVGWANLFENLIQNVVLGLSGNNNSNVWDKFFGTSATSGSGERVTIESIFFNRIPIIDANFFKVDEAGGQKLTKTEELVGPVKPGQSSEIEVANTENIVYRLRRNLSTMYVLIRNMSIAFMLFVLVGVGIRIALTSSATKKADYKKFLTSWVFGLCIVLFIHLFMYTVFVINDYFVNVCNNWSQGAAKEEVSTLIQKTNSNQEMNLYDAIRVKAYAFNWREGVPATIVYIYLIYLLIRFLLIYFKRYLTIYILALVGSFMGVRYALDRLLGRKTNSFNKWLKDFSFNVMLQTVHAFIYVLFISIALSVSQKNIAGALIGVFVLNFMLQADKFIIKIFGLDKAGSLADVNQPESWKDVALKFLPIYTLTRRGFNLSKGLLVGRNGIIRRGIDFVGGTDTYKDADKALNKAKFKVIGLLPGKYRMLREDLSYETKKKYYDKIKKVRQSTFKKYTRNVKAATDLALGNAGKVASIALAIANPAAGAALMIKSRKTIKKYRTPTKAQRRAERYTGSTGRALNNVKKADMAYNKALDTYTDNEYNFQERYNQLIRDYRNASGNTLLQNLIKDKMKEELTNREKERAVELHKLQEADEKKTKTRVEYGNAKRESRRKVFGFAEKVTGLEAVEDIVTNQSRATFKANDTLGKDKKQIAEFAKMAKIEKEINKINKNIRDELNKKSEEEKEALRASFESSFGKELDENKQNELNGKLKEIDNKYAKMYETTVNDAYSESGRMKVSPAIISNAIKSYMANEEIKKVTFDDVEEVLDKVKDLLEQNEKEVVINDEVKQKVKQAFEDKMVKDKQGLGYEAKDAIAVIREALGNKDVLDRTRDSRVTEKRKEFKDLDSASLDKLKEYNEQLLNKFNELNALNDNGKVKYKSSFVSVNKIVKELKKKGK